MKLIFYKMSLISKIAKATAVVTIIIGGITYAVKPDDESFDPYLRKFMEKSSYYNAPYIESWKRHSVTNYNYESSDFIIKDYIFVKIAKVVPRDDQEMYFIGFMEKWFPLNT